MAHGTSPFANDRTDGAASSACDVGESQQRMAPVQALCPPPTESPAAGPSGPRSAAPRRTQTPQVRTILVVEDSRLSADAIRLMLRGVGLRMRRADTLATALRHLSLYRPDAVLVDLGLPDGSGTTLIAAIRSSGIGAPHVVAMSGDPDLEGAARAAGADDFLAKPLGPLAAFLGALDPVLAPTCQPHCAKASAVPAPAPDALALRDDLVRAARMLRRIGDDDVRDSSAHDTLGYVTRFLGGLAHHTGDSALRALADTAHQTGHRTALLRALRTRIDAQPRL